MDKFRIFETNEFLKKLKKIDTTNRNFIIQKLTKQIYNQLKENPYIGKNIKKLVGYSPATWRYRIGKFRLFYTIDIEDKIIDIIYIEFRKDAY